MKVIGIDENGLGPVLGPFVISAAMFDIGEGDPFFDTRLERLMLPMGIADSKAIFKRRFPYTYSKGEIIALSFLPERNWRELLNNNFHLLIDDEEKDIYLKDLSLPIWAKEVRYDYRKKTGFSGFRGYAIFPRAFNRLLKDMHKFQMDVKYFLELAHELSEGVEDDVVVLAGKVGGYTYYVQVFLLLGITRFHILRETRGHSAYRVFYRDRWIEIHFLMDGDAVYYPIAIASIVGKYVREVSMKLLNEHYGFEGRIPYASGYRHDARTMELIKKMGREDFIRKK